MGLRGLRPWASPGVWALVWHADLTDGWAVGDRPRLGQGRAEREQPREQGCGRGPGSLLQQTRDSLGPWGGWGPRGPCGDHPCALPGPPGSWGLRGPCGDRPCALHRFNDEVKHIKVVEKDSWVHITEAKKFESLLVRDARLPPAWPRGWEEGPGRPPRPRRGGVASAPTPAGRACRGCPPWGRRVCTAWGRSRDLCPQNLVVDREGLQNHSSPGLPNRNRKLRPERLHPGRGCWPTSHTHIHTHTHAHLPVPTPHPHLSHPSWLKA